MDAILATIVDGGQAISQTPSSCRIKLITLLFYRFNWNHATASSTNTLSASPMCWNGPIHKIHADGGENGSIMVEMFVCCV